MSRTTVNAVSLGVDVAESRKGLDAVLLDERRRILHNAGHLTPADVAALASAHRVAVVCIDSPSSWAKSGKSRAAERELARLGIRAFCTPTDPGDHPFYRWMRTGFSVYEAVAATYPLFRGTTLRGTAAEVFPHATSVLLAGGGKPSDESKVTFRRRVLEANGVATGPLPTIDRVDAALAALTGILALEGSLTWVGDPEEGVVLLPPSHSAGNAPNTASR